MALILRDKKNTWNNGIIPFEVKEEDFTTDALKNIYRAIKHWKDNTRWQIVPKKNGHEDYVVFRNGDRCHSDVGRKGGKQFITLSNNCGLSASIHEIGHCVGFKHEHTRNDRDNYVVVMEDRVRLGNLNFKKVSSDKYRDYGDYDYDSIMHYPKSSFRRINKVRLEVGFTSSEFYHTKEGVNLFLLKNGGEVKIYRIGNIFVGRELERYRWSKGWTNNRFYEINGQTYIHQIKRKGQNSAGTDNVHIHKVNDDGSIGKKVKYYNYSEGWTNVEFYEIKGKTYRLISRNKGYSSNKNFHIDIMNSNGTVGNEVDRYKWTEGWSSIKIYKINGQTYIHQLKKKGQNAAMTHNVHIHKINDDGSIGKKVKYYKYSEGWTNVEFYESNGQTYRIMLKQKGFSSFGKNIHIDRVNSDGTVGRKVKYYKWNEGWTSLSLYENNGFLHLFLLNASSGKISIHLIEKKTGRIGDEMVVQPGINIYAPREIGKATGLSSIDIDAANSLI